MFGHGSMGDALLWIALGLGGLYLGAEGLVRGSAALALGWASLHWSSG